MWGSPPCAMCIDCTIASYCAATASASGNALFATAEKSVGKRIERIMTAGSEREAELTKLTSQSLPARHDAILTDCGPRGLATNANAHSVERSGYKECRDYKEQARQNMSYQRSVLSELAGLAADAHREFDGQ